MSDAGAITLRLVTTRDIASAVIRHAQMGFWVTHVDAVMPDGTLLGAHVRGGVQARPVGYDAADRPRELRVTLRVPNRVEATFHATCAAQIGRPYDWRAIVDFGLSVLPGGRLLLSDDPTAWRDPSAWFCSELIMAALLSSGVFPGDLPATPRHVTPRDLCFAVAPLCDPSTWMAGPLQ